MDGEPVIETGAARLIKPSLTTCFHIDYTWWQRNEREWRVYLLSHLCADHRAALESVADGTRIDWVDPNTAEVRSIDGIQHALISHCSLQPDYISPHTTLVDAVFRVFLANGNAPLTVNEIAERIRRPANTILKTLSGVRVYKGLRPVEG
jgi:hypothetical protein